MKRLYLEILLASGAALLAACSDGNAFSGADFSENAQLSSDGFFEASSSSAARTSVSSVYELGACSADNYGETVYVVSESGYFACSYSSAGYSWERLGGTSSAASSSSVLAVSSSSLADTTVSEIWNGKMKTPQTTYRNGAYYMVISSAEELAYFANQVTNIGDTSLNAYLTKDIRLNPDSIVDMAGNLLVDESELREWTPIGSNALEHLFCGIFDGNGHTVSGVYVNNSSADRAGFFGTTNGGQIKNLGIVNSYIVGNNYVGGVVGRANRGSMDRVYFKGYAKGGYVGGIIGYQNGDSLTNCYSRGKVYGTTRAAGVTGYKASGTLNACYSLSPVRGSNYIYAVTSYTKCTNCYYQADSGVSEWTAETDQAEEKTASAMKSASFAQTLNAAVGDSYWSYRYDVNDGYPAFTWQIK